MPLDFHCPECSTGLRVKEEHAGKKMKCPKCAKIVPIPQASEQEGVEVEVIEDQPAETVGDPFAFEDIDRPRTKKKEPAVADRPKPIKTAARYAPCPHCGAQEARKVDRTWWGSWIGPHLFHTVRCQECGGSFNGKTGDTNLVPILLFVTVQVLVIGVLLFILFAMLKRKGIL